MNIIIYKYGRYLYCSSSAQDTLAEVFSGKLLEPAQFDCYQFFCSVLSLCSLLSPHIPEAVYSELVAGLASVKLLVPGSDPN